MVMLDTKIGIGEVDAVMLILHMYMRALSRVAENCRNQRNNATSYIVFVTSVRSSLTFTDG